MANLRIIPLRSSAKECSRCLSRSRVIAAVAVLLTLPFVTEVAYAVSPNTAAVPVLTATVGQSVTCNPTSKTRPQPTLPRGFTEKTMYRGCLTYPTAISFHHKINNTYTRVYVAEKGGKVWDCDLAASPTCTLFSDLSTNNLICNDGDRGLLGLAADPQDDTKVYVLYTYTVSGCNGDGETYGQLSRLTSGSETKILPPANDRQQWCFYSTSHNIGGLDFGGDNTTLYASAGDGASFLGVDFGQLDNACGDGMSYPLGAFRSQGISSYSDGGFIQITNLNTMSPSISSVAKGFRNPFRFARKPGTNDWYVGNVGWETWEAIDHISMAEQNFGWPCYEGWDPNNNFGPAPQPGYQDTGYCVGIDGVTAPFYAYSHQGYVTAADSKGKTCGGKPSGGGPDQNGSVISAIGFTDGTSTTYPVPFKSALYFGDVGRKCIWTMQPPNNTPQAFARGLQGGPVDLKAGQNGDLFYVDIVTSTVRRITHR